MTKKIVVIGAGPGLGNAVARRFGREGFEVVLVSRDKKKLEGYKKEFELLRIPITVYAADAGDIESLDVAIDAILREVGTPDVVVYNVGITSMDEDPLMSEDIMHHFAVDVVGAYETIRKFATSDFAAKRGSIILTGGILAEAPYPGYVALSMDKAALRNLALEKNGELASKGIYVGTVMVCGVIGGDDHFAPENIAEKFWELNEARDTFEMRFE